MKAIVKTRPAKGAEYLDVDLPSIGPNDLLVKVQAAAICGTDNHIYDWTPWAQEQVTPPMIFGHEYAGQVVEVGSAVTGWQVGDMVAAETHIPCQQCYQCRTGRQHTCEQMRIIGVHVNGAFAEYAALPAKGRSPADASGAAPAHPAGTAGASVVRASPARG